MSRNTLRAKKIQAEREARCEACEYWKTVPGETYIPICLLWWDGFQHRFFKKGAECKNFIKRGEANE